MHSVELTRIEIEFAKLLGIERHHGALGSGRKDAHGFDGDPLEIHIAGVAGEMAFCKCLGMYFMPTIDTYKSPDVGDNIQVRTRSEKWHDLLVRPNDKDEDKFVLVVGKMPIFSVIGWAYGSEAKHKKWLQSYGDRPPAYFMPQRALHDASSICNATKKITPQPKEKTHPEYKFNENWLKFNASL